MWPKPCFLSVVHGLPSEGVMGQVAGETIGPAKSRLTGIEIVCVRLGLTLGHLHTPSQFNIKFQT